MRWRLIHFVKSQRSFVLENPTGTMKHAWIRPFWCSLHALPKQTSKEGTIWKRKKSSSARSILEERNRVCAYHFDDIEWLSDEHLTPPSTMTIQRQPFDSANENVLCVLIKHTPGRSHLRCPPSNPLSFSTSKRSFLLTSLAPFFVVPCLSRWCFFSSFFLVRRRWGRWYIGMRTRDSQQSVSFAKLDESANATQQRVEFRFFFCFQFGQGWSRNFLIVSHTR